jgi:hypothetical protein
MHDAWWTYLYCIQWPFGVAGIRLY